MEESCWFCKKWEQHYYWDHLKLTNHRFMKVMLKDFSQGMAIPKHFVENFKGELSKTINLEVSKGKLWQFNLQKISGSFVIIDGWKEFVDDHGIKEGEYLVFTCSGNSSFQVQIFDNGACLEMLLTYQLKMLKLWPRKDAKNKTKIATLLILLKISIQLASQRQSRLQVTNYLQLERSVRLKFSVMKPLNPTEKVVMETLEAKKLKSKKRSIDFDAIKPESPYFIRLMKHTAVNVLFFMAIPAVFFTKHFSHKPEKITLHNHQGKKWDVICSYHCFSWGFKRQTWKTFVRENYLKVGDACVFELKAFTRKNAAMSVRIVRATDEDLV
ncbi:B3 domain-containing protein Os12g0592300-like [Dendrobium catenatum]|uniref:B3 domain-containing protein Os12g0592300-like n=1 Tax=Dendrobium catenatum TaxID=906689 RepID=UPI00109F6F55|nr:B3 domain-containing protein Os12g0592300-like [Dendrobium catenatum]